MTVIRMVQSKKIVTREQTLFLSFFSFSILQVFSFGCLKIVQHFVFLIVLSCSSIQVLWTSIIRSALQSVLSMKSNDPSIELQPVVDTVCQLYSSKIAADLQADSSHIRRQTLPEFMYSTYLFQTGEPGAAKHALTEFISLVFYFEKVIDVLSTASSLRLFCVILFAFQAHSRLLTFGKFLSNASGNVQHFAHVLV